ncbi:SirA family protein [Methylophaga frappieri]|uniref:SirA family protein n=1 Tax=Methylophaga frappieri (strain ATCC BAA-2434 / DSM 25690 / JAM7) TaxID=754477 RepID=I1YFR5_METFJ|nr:sulfurtransferase TusA family protein [Methylophaga frappieri]AFJ01758.1 SirA family protein [Methylophaga frappieri]
MSHHYLNAERLLCPMPVIRTQDKVKQLQAGDTLAISCTDPGALHDIPAWARIHGHEITEQQTREAGWVITVRVGASH